jgi:hypothetical protein
MSSEGLPEPATQPVRCLLEQASLGIAMEDFAENIFAFQSGAVVPAGDSRLLGNLVHDGRCV